MTSVPHPFSSEVRAHPNLVVVKIHGKHRRAERASKILRKLGVDHRTTVCVCHHADEVGPAITKVLFDEDTKTSLAERQTAYLKKQFSTTTGDASLRIVGLLEELAKRPMNSEQNKPAQVPVDPDD